MPHQMLVVDDNALNRDLLSRRLRQQGHEVIMATNGSEALGKMREQTFDLILLDIMMPEMNGYQVLEAMKSDEVLRHIPVIVISAVDEIESVVRCIEMGAEDYLPKPFNPVLLKARIGATLDKKRMRDQEQAHLQQIAAEKKRADDLLHVILPHPVVEELKANNRVKPRRYENVAVMFCDIVDFTQYCDQHEPEDVVTHLQKMVEIFEEMSLKHDLEKIKTVGDAFMTTANLLKPVENPVLNCVQCGLEMVAAAPSLPPQWQVRVGVHIGPVMAGVVGHRQYLFDVLGDTVNVAARIESEGVANAVSASAEAWKFVSHLCQSDSHGLVTIKGKGEMEIYQIKGRKHYAT